MNRRKPDKAVQNKKHIIPDSSFISRKHCQFGTGRSPDL